VPTGPRHAKVTDAGITWNYTTVLNVIFLALATVLVVRYFHRGGGVAMLRMMNEPHAAPDEATQVARAS
jgi:hypothetical protein